MEVLTIGFAEMRTERFFGALRDAGVERVVDVRLSSRSRQRVERHHRRVTKALDLLAPQAV